MALFNFLFKKKKATVKATVMRRIATQVEEKSNIFFNTRENVN